MSKAISSKQITIKLSDETGSLAQAISEFSAYKINLVAIAVYSLNDRCYIQFVSENNKHAMRLLKEKGYEVKEEEVVLCSVDNTPGALQKLTTRIADAGVDLKLIYGSVEKTGTSSRIVMVADKPKALLNALKGK